MDRGPDWETYWSTTEFSPVSGTFFYPDIQRFTHEVHGQRSTESCTGTIRYGYIVRIQALHYISIYQGMLEKRHQPCYHLGTRPETGEYVWRMLDKCFFFQNVKQFFPEFFLGCSVLEIGSLDINGSVRRFFESVEYTGIDIGSGSGVDVICRGEDFSSQSCRYKVVISTEVFEHTEAWDLIFLNMLRLMKRSGMIIFSCASWGREQHGTSLFHADSAPYTASTSDYYKNLVAEDFYAAFKLEYWFSCHTFMRDASSLYFVDIGRDNKNCQASMSRFKILYDEYLYKKNVLGLPDHYMLEQPSNRILVP